MNRASVPQVIRVDYAKLAFGQNPRERQLKVERNIFSSTYDVTERLEPAKPFVFGMNRR